MSLNIKNEGTHEAVRELARLRGVSQTEAVDEAVRTRLAALRLSAQCQQRLERTLAIAAESGRMLREANAVLSTDDLYDEQGLPR